MTLRSTNLNLLPVLQALLRECSVTKAAKALGLSQPATSAALARLRLELDDPLLIQVGKGMIRSDRAKMLMPELDQLCTGIEAMFRKPTFDPLRSADTFVVAAPDYLAVPIGQFLLNQLRQEAPNVRLRFVDIPAKLDERLLARDIDVAVGVRFGGRWSELRMVTGFWNQMVLIVREGHPLTRLPTIDIDAVGKYQRIAFAGALDQTAPGQSDSLLAESSLAFEQWLALPAIVQSSEATAIIPKSLADDLLQSHPLAILPHPSGMSPRNTGIFWSQVQDANPANQWLRSKLIEALTALLGPAKSSLAPPLAHALS